MTPRSELRRKIRRDVRERSRAARHKIASHPTVARRRRRRTLYLIVGTFALLALLATRCSCDQDDTAPIPTPTPQGRKSQGTVAPRAPLMPPRHLPAAQKSARERFAAPEAETPTWLMQFRRQVAARSPRLRECFREASHPGALRWSAVLHFELGSVSDHVFEPLGNTAAPGVDERQCLEKVLAAPRYHFEDAPDVKSPSSRVGMVLEF